MRRLGELEAIVMGRLWSSPEPMSVREMREAIADRRALAYTTVMTVLDNLHTKGRVTREMEGRAYRYRAAESRDAYSADLMREALDSSGNRASAFLHFVDAIEPEEAAELRRALRDHDRRRRK